MAIQIQLRRGTESQWTSANPTLAQGEVAYSIDTNKIKIGNGSSTWTQLSYLTANSDQLTEGSTNLFFTTERAQDAVGGMVTGNTESGISVTYDDETGKLNFDVNDPTITLSGDVTGSATMTDLGNVTITTTIAADSVALGTDTTGNYVATITGTTDQVSVTGSGSENASVTLSLPQSIATTSSPTFAGGTLDAVRIGVTNANEIDTSSGNLILDSTGGTVEIDDNLIISGNLTVNGITTTINATTISVDDKNIELGSVETPTDTTANGGGITLKGTTDKTFNWSDTTDSWTSSEHIDLANGKVIKINGSEVLSATQYTGNAATVTNGVVTTGTYSDPSWITSLAWSKISTAPTTLSGYGITDAQALDADLTAIAALAGTSGFLKKTAENTWSLDTNTYLTGNQSISLSGDATGSGTTAITLTLANTGVTANTYGSATAIPVITVDAKGRITNVTTSSVEGLPSQTGNAGKYLTTDGTSASWATVEAGLNPLLLGGM